MMLSFELRNNADWRQAFMLPTTDLTGAALRMRLGTLYLSTGNGRIVIDDPTVGAFSFVVPAADLNTVQPGHYRVDLLMFQPGKVKTVFTGSIDVVAVTWKQERAGGFTVPPIAQIFVALISYPRT